MIQVFSCFFSYNESLPSIRDILLRLESILYIFYIFSRNNSAGIIGKYTAFSQNVHYKRILYFLRISGIRTVHFLIIHRNMIRDMIVSIFLKHRTFLLVYKKEHHGNENMDNPYSSGAYFVFSVLA